MEALYRYEARDRKDRAVEGEVIAYDRRDAEERVAALGLRTVDLRHDLPASFGLLFARDFDLRALATLYSSLSERVRHGGDLSTGLRDVLEFIEDVRLRAAVSVWIAADNDGARTSEAMRVAGFPPRHVAAVAGLEGAGSVDKALRQLAAECRRDYDIRSGLRRIVRQPVIYGVLAMVAYWAALAFMVPPVMAQISNLGTRGFDSQPPFVKFVAAIGTWAHDHLVLWTVCCSGVVIGIAILVRSSWGRRCADLLPIWRMLTERADMASLWGAYAVLYEAGEAQDRAAQLLAEAGRRPQSRDWFLGLAAALRGGYRLDDAVRRAEFPRYVVAAIGQAMTQRGGTAEAIQRFADARTADVIDLLDRLQVRVDLMLKIGMGILILVLAGITYMPIFIAASHMR